MYHREMGLIFVQHTADYTFIDQDRLGTVQLSDIFYNTLGGTIGGLIYYLCTKLQRKKDEPSVDEKKG